MKFVLPWVALLRSTATFIRRHFACDYTCECSLIHGRRKECLVSRFAHAWNFPRNLGNCGILVFSRIWITHNRVILVFFRLMATHSDSDGEFLSALIGLMHNPHKERIQWPEAMEKWPCGDCFTFYSVVLHDDVLIENNKYGCVIMQNNGAMKIVNFTHAQTAETRHSFLCPWMPGMRLVRVQPPIT